MVLASSSGNSTSELSNTCKYGKITKPDKGEAIDETGWSATADIRDNVDILESTTTHFWNPIAKMLLMSVEAMPRCNFQTQESPVMLTSPNRRCNRQPKTSDREILQTFSTCFFPTLARSSRS
jgi:hypothetical protein